MEPVYKTHGDAMRQLLELAITCGRCWQSSQTEYIHFCYSIRDESHHHTIPIYENILFILALMRSRNMENINEAKGLLSKFLHFQSQEGEMSGNFPIYIHDYPFCKDGLWGVHLLAPLHWIYKNFHHVLGTELKQILKTSLVKLIDYCLKADLDKKAPYAMGLQIAACAKSTGTLLSQERLVISGEKLYQELKNHPDFTTWHTPSGLSSLIIAYQMMFPSLMHSPEKDFWDHLTKTWHPQLGAYCGPGWKEYQVGYEPQVTVYDYFMGYLSGKYSYRCFTDHPVQLQAALLHPTEDTLPPFEECDIARGTLKELPWQVSRDSKIAFSSILKDVHIMAVQEKTFIPLKLLWGTPHRLHSLVCQGGTASRIETKASGKVIEVYFTFKEAPNVDDEDKAQEICFFLDEYPNLEITIDNTPATTFKLENQVILSDDQQQIHLSFSIEAGEGEFFGHLMKANRPNQLSCVGKNRFSVFDRQIFLRTIRRSDACIIKARFEIAKLGE